MLADHLYLSAGAVEFLLVTGKELWIKRDCLSGRLEPLRQAIFESLDGLDLEVPLFGAAMLALLAGRSSGRVGEVETTATFLFCLIHRVIGAAHQVVE